MRVFGNDAPQFFSFQLEGSETVYNIPLAASMPTKTIKLIDNGFSSQVEMLRVYLGDMVDELTAGTVKDIVTAWMEASKDVGASVGESKASSD